MAVRNLSACTDTPIMGAAVDNLILKLTREWVMPHRRVGADAVVVNVSGYWRDTDVDSAFQALIPQVKYWSGPKPQTIMGKKYALSTGDIRKAAELEVSQGWSDGPAPEGGNDTVLDDAPRTGRGSKPVYSY